MKKLILILALLLSSCGSQIASNVMIVPPGCAVYKPADKDYYSGVCLGDVFVHVWKQADGTWLMAAYKKGEKVKFYYKDEKGSWVEFDSKMPNPDLPPDLLRDNVKET